MLTVGAADITAACRRLGIDGVPVCVHAALGTFGWVAGGGATVIAGLLDAGCTVLVPTFSTAAYAIAPPSHLRPPRNGWDYGVLARRPHFGMQPARLFSPSVREIDGEMGAVPAALLKLPDRVRGNHPLASFAGIGTLAKPLIESQGAEDVFAPLVGMAEAGGFVVLMGVGLNRMTLLHQAEKAAGRTLFRRWALDARGEAAMFEVGGCSEGFERLASLLAACEQRTTVGRSVWRVFPAYTVLETVVPEIRAHPEITHCGDALCRRCRDAIAGGPRLADAIEGS